METSPRSFALYNDAPLGAIVVAPGSTDATIASAGGNPYGTSYASAHGLPRADTLAAARHQGSRLTRVAAALAGRETAMGTPSGA